jgi:hypothetical protein
MGSLGGFVSAWGGAPLSVGTGGGGGPWCGTLGGGAVPPEMNHLRVFPSHVNSVEPQLPYEHFLPGFVHAAPGVGWPSGQPSVRLA